MLSEVCFRLLGGAEAKTSAQAGEVWLRQGIALSPPTWEQQGRTEFPGGRTLPAHVPHCPQGSDDAPLLPSAAQTAAAQTQRALSTDLARYQAWGSRGTPENLPCSLP